MIPTTGLSFNIFVVLGVFFALTCAYAAAILARLRFERNFCLQCAENWTIRHTVHLLICLSTLGK